MDKNKKNISAAVVNDYICGGLSIKENGIPKGENRLHTLLIKGLIVYLIVMGTMGAFLSEIGSDYSPALLNIIVIIEALYCCTLFYSNVWQNIGYLLLLVLMIAIFAILRFYIASGLFAVYNDFAVKASDYFGSNATRTINELVSNRNLAITAGMGYLCVIGCILTNIWVSRKMKYTMLVPMSLMFLLFPMYFELEPKPVYMIMLFTGLVSSMIFKGSGQYRLSFDNSGYTVNLKKKTVSYSYASRLGLYTVGCVAAVCFVFIALVNVMYPLGTFKEERGQSAFRADTIDYVENFMLSGFEGLFNRYSNVGGISSGRLGGVSSVSLDYQTDLTVEFTPYSYNRIYLKSFEGIDYVPYTNEWFQFLTSDSKVIFNGIYDKTAAAMEAAWENNAPDSAMGIFNVKNVAASKADFLPYYSFDYLYDYADIGDTVSYRFYPQVSYGLAKDYLGQTDVTDRILPDYFSDEECDGYRDEYNEKMLDVPKENYNTIRAFCKRCGLSADDGLTPDEVADRLAAYFQDNYPYTLRAGSTPSDEDFVNYFLNEQKKGYCVHFASAAVLIFRYLGIPARYVEGYAIDADEITENANVENKDYRDFYSGYNPIGESAVVSLDVTDADAHAWVEIYDDINGWHPADVTPASSGDDDEGGNSTLYDFFLDFFGMNGAGTAANNNAAVGNDGNNTSKRVNDSFEGIMLAFVVILSIAVALAAVIVSIIIFIRLYRYRKAGVNDRLIIKYHDY
jgi:transglutaminase-like putative cysteine protease